MTPDIPQPVLDLLMDIVRDKDAAMLWYDTEFVPAIGSTAAQCVAKGETPALVAFLEAVKTGVYS